MYALTCNEGYKYPGAEPAYVTEIVSVGAGLAAIASDQSLSLFNPLELGHGPSTRLQTNHGNLATVKPYDAANSTVATTGENGIVSMWDLRLDPGRARILDLGGNQTGLLSLACNPSALTIAAGSELAGSQAQILLWDVRVGSKPRIQYSEIHSDDVTELNFDPGNPAILLSGSTDGLVNICDIRIDDEDEFVVTAFNHGSVSHAGFLNSTDIFAHSHDEKFALYSVADGDQNAPALLDLGDAREALGCQYVANVFAKPNGVEAIIGVGSQDKLMFQLIHLSKADSWSIDTASTVNLPGGHGEELVRSFCFIEGHEVVCTAGEDGCIRAWRPGG